MGRYKGNAVTEPNPFVSVESNEIDPNTDKNPLLDNADPTDGAEPDREHGDDFEVAGEDLVDLKKTTEDDIVQEIAVDNNVSEIDNIVKEGNETASVVQALASISCEMYALLGKEGKLSTGEALVLNGLVSSCESVCLDITNADTPMPSLENYKIPGLAYSNANVSMESIGDKLAIAMNTLNLNMERLFKNAIGLVKSLTPLFDAQISRAQTIKAGLNNARRDAGQKTITGKFVANLAIDGRGPDANTVVRTANYLGEIADQVLSYSALETSTANVKNALDAVKKGIDLKDVRKTGLIAKLIVLFGGNTPIAFMTALGVRDEIFSQIEFNGDYTVDMFGLYSSLAKVQTGCDYKHLEARKSLPLFGGTEIMVTNYRKSFSSRIDHNKVPEIKLVKGGKQSGVIEMQSLTPKQQVETIDAALKVLLTGRAYFKDYAARNKRAMEAFKFAFRQQIEANNDNASAGRRFEGLFVSNAINYYSRLYWRGIFVDQAKIAGYCRKSAKALIDLVEASSVGAQGGVETSTEAYNDFL